MRDPRRHLSALVLVVVAAGLVLSGCPKKSEPVANTTTSSSAAGPKVDKEQDQETAQASLLSAADLPGSGWKKSTTATTAPKKKGNTNAGNSFDCPELDDVLGSGYDAKATAADAPILERKTPYGEVRNTVGLFPSDEDAQAVIDATKSDTFRNCLERGLRHDNAKENREIEVNVGNWSLAKVGDARAAYEVTLTQDVSGTTVEAFVGLAVVRVGRAVTTMFVSYLEPLGAEAKEIAETSVQKIRDNS